MFFIILIVFTFVENTFMEELQMFDLESLSELSLDKLLHVKNSLDTEDERNFKFSNAGVNEEDTNADFSDAQPLQGKLKKPFQRGSYDTSWQKNGGKKGLSTIFQISVTALAFLAFGGYLLCLLVQALKSKQTSTADTAMMMMMTAPVRKRRPTRRRRATMWPNADPETLYHALQMFSEGYATYHIYDYKYYNYTLQTNNY